MPVDMISAKQFYRRFGDLCSLPELRRRLRIGALTAAVVAGAGVAVAVALLPQSAAEDEMVVAAAPTASAAGAQPARAPERLACEQQTWPYLDGQCLSGEKRPAVRVLPPNAPVKAPPATANEIIAAAKVAAAEQRAEIEKRRKSERARDRGRSRDADDGDPRRAYATPYRAPREQRARWRQPRWGWW